MNFMNAKTQRDAKDAKEFQSSSLLGVFALLCVFASKKPRLMHTA